MINQIYIIESLPATEKHTGKELYNDTITRYIQYFSKNIEHDYTSVNSRQEFENKLKSILSQTTKKDELILHIEAHGGFEEMQFSNGDFMKWTDLENILIDINLKSKNKLHLNLATCYGMHIAEKINLKKTAPYKSYTSALRTLKPSEIIADNTILYKSIIETQNIYEAYIQFCKINPKTQLRIKDIETAMKFILSIQISRFLGHKTLIKDFFDNYLNVDIDVTNLNKLEDQQIVEYILMLFLNRYLPTK
jgi:glycosylphosphatidylinositol transamidase (GPIT) subunit GPI8